MTEPTEDLPAGPDRPYIDCPECPHSPDQHADLQGCHGDADSCPCTESKSSLLLENQ